MIERVIYLVSKFDELIIQPIEVQVKEINEAVKRARTKNKPLDNSRTFAQDSGLGVVFSKVKLYMKKQGYLFNGIEFVKDNRKDNVDEVILQHVKSQTGTLKKTSCQMYDNTSEELEEFFEKYSYFKKSDLLDVIIKEGLKNLNR